MGLRDEVAKQVGSRNTGRGVFLEDLGLYEIEVSFAGEFESALGDAHYWKLEGVIAISEEGPLAQGQEIVVIHNLAKDKWGYSRDERQVLQKALRIESWEDAAGCLVIVDVWERVTKSGKTVNVRSWLASPRNRNAVSEVETSDNAYAENDAKTQDDGDDGFEVMPF